MASSSGSAAKAVDKLSESLKKKGIDAFKDSFPAKIAFINSLLENELLNKDNDAILPPVEEVTPAVPPPLAPGGSTEAAAAAGAAAGGGRRKKRKMDEGAGGSAATATNAHAAHAHSDSEEESEDELPGGRSHGAAGGAGMHYDHAHDFAVPCNKTIIRVMELLRKEWKEAVEIVGAVKLWIQLSIPPIESGGQFHVGVQEEVIQELTRFEDVAYNYLESPSKYFQTRAKLAAKLSRHRTVMDYRQSLLEADSLEYLNLRMAATELRNSYLVAYDLLAKNMDKLQAPSQNFGSRMVV